MVSGFIHAEDHYWDGQSLNSEGYAYKSISLGRKEKLCYHFGKKEDHERKFLIADININVSKNRCTTFG